ncbi:hypothetical protein MMC18_001621 [Xylographa bjoerkii]|nr:hypothetical protein [Xylographa bjoerkii]
MASNSRKRKRSIEDDNSLNQKILMAVDFGTTFSGLAWASISQPDSQTIIDQWPDPISDGYEGITSDKVPSELQYSGKSFRWGSQIPKSGFRYTGFKLELDPEQHSKLFSLLSKLPDATDLPSAYNVPAEKMVSDYLTMLRKHGEKAVRCSLPKSLSQYLSFEYIITTPAVWSPRVQAKTRAAAELAGFGKAENIRIISEPEAAAIFALRTIPSHSLAIGDIFVVCDAGGGTVDLISYRVLAIDPILEVEEACVGSGGMYGGTFLNRRFEKFLRNKLGDEDEWDDDILEEALKRFEGETKRAFHGKPSESYNIPVHGIPDSAELHVKRGLLKLSGSDLLSIFDPVITEIIALVQGQIRATKATVKAVLVVGGFGQSSYLRDRIRDAVEGSDIEVIKCPNGWTAIVRGALMKGLIEKSSISSVRVGARAARKHYGTEIFVRYSSLKHDKTKRWWNAFEKAHSIHVIDWFIKKGTKVNEERPKTVSYHEMWPFASGRPSLHISQIYSCDDISDQVAPLYITDSRVHELVKLTADLGRVPLDNFPVVKGKNGKKSYEIDYDIEVKFFSASTTYAFIHDGKQYGAVTAEYIDLNNVFFVNSPSSKLVRNGKCKSRVSLKSNSAEVELPTYANEMAEVLEASITTFPKSNQTFDGPMAGGM